jgi:cytochrome b
MGHAVVHNQAAEARTGPHSVRVWDRVVRLVHWGLVACVALNLFILEDGEAPHQWVGYVASALVLVRMLWGFAGSKHARFHDFFPTPTRVRAHVAALLRGEAPAYVGHNPLGALMMLTLLVLVMSLGLSGWLQTTDALWGNEALQELHETLAKALLGLAGLHAAAALLMGRIERVRLVRAMITGVKEFR